MFISSLIFINLKGGSHKYFSSFHVTFLEKLVRKTDLAHFRHDENPINTNAF